MIDVSVLSSRHLTLHALSDVRNVCNGDVRLKSVTFSGERT